MAVIQNSAELYSEKISTKRPGLILILLDQSGSMADPGDYVKMDKAAEVVNALIDEVSKACDPGDGVRRRCYIGVIGYGERVEGVVGDWIDNLSENVVKWKKVTQEVDSPEGVQTLEVDLPTWVQPKAENGTPMDKGLALAVDLAEKWAKGHQDSFPPIVFNITDGQPNGLSVVPDPNFPNKNMMIAPATEAQARRLSQIRTNQGNLLLYCAHISGKKAKVLELPSDIAEFDRLSEEERLAAGLLFRMSSIVPPQLYVDARESGFTPRDGARGFVFNAPVATLVKLLKFGSTRFVKSAQD